MSNETEEFKERKSLYDNGIVWGWMCLGVFRSIPKVPLINSEMGPPPFHIQMPSGELREVINHPEGKRDD